MVVTKNGLGGDASFSILPTLARLGNGVSHVIWTTSEHLDGIVGNAALIYNPDVGVVEGNALTPQWIYVDANNTYSVYRFVGERMIVVIEPRDHN